MFKIEQIICLKMNLAINNRQMLIYHETQTTNQASPSLCCNPLRLADQFTYLGSNISSTESVVDYTENRSVWLNKMGFIPNCIYGNTNVRMYPLDANEGTGKKLERNYTRILRGVWKKSCKHDPTKQQL